MRSMGSRSLATLFALVLLLSACSSGGTDEADAPQAESATEREMTDGEMTDGETTDDEMAGMTDDEMAGMTDGSSGGAPGDVISGSATGTSPCERSGAPASPGQTAGSHGERGMIVQADLDQATRLELQRQQVLAREVASRFPTVADAEAGGYSMSTEYVTCIGAHYTNLALAAGFDPAAPSELLYDGTTPESRIVGLSYLVLNRGGPPEGFAGQGAAHQRRALTPFRLG